MASPEFDARALAAHVLGVARPSEVMLADDVPDEPFRSLVEQRALRVPLQHLVGSVGFRYLDLLVGPGVFVPRPETELVAGAAIDAAAMCRHIASADPHQGQSARALAARTSAGRAALPAGPVVVDLCSGSGAIALSVSKEVAGSVVHAVELDPAALEWSRRNDPDGTVTWHQGDVADCLHELDGQVDVVVSNPPYVPVGTEVDRETEQDPQLALWGGADGLDVVRQVESTARRLLKPGGVVVVEHDVTQGESAPAVFAGWSEVQDHQDLTQRDRYLTARWSG